MSSKKPVWQMCKEAIKELGGRATYKQIIDFIRNKYGDVNEGTIRCQTIICTVNHPSRIHYPENKKPRICKSRYDFLYSIGRGEVVLYDPEKHGQWSIVKRDGKLLVVQAGLEEVEGAEEIEEEGTVSFPLESHLRDFLAKNLRSVKQGLKLFRDENGRDGVEYPTDVGPIDILAVDENGDFVVFELKLSRGPDKACGQLMRYMGWVRKNLASGHDVKGVLLAQKIDEKLKYAASEYAKIRLCEYEVSFNIKSVGLLLRGN